MHIHILGICGTFMGGIALLARAKGHTVTGSDTAVYPPMSTQCEEQGIIVREGFDADHLDGPLNCVVVGNVMKRGHDAVEAMLNRHLPYESGPEWLARHVLFDREVLAVAGTHGKTTTASLLAWVLEDLGLEPGFLIGGIPQNFGESARLGKGKYFVLEADEYDTAFFDKRSKFLHYRPRHVILNNLEFDHADIFADLAAIKWQFHQLLRMVPSAGNVIVNGGDANLKDTLEMGCWTPVTSFGLGSDSEWTAQVGSDANRFDVHFQGQFQASVQWSLLGAHNRANCLAVFALTHKLGLDPKAVATAIGRFQGVKRRLEVRGEVHGVTVYDDFAHHPTAIATTIEGLRAKVQQQRLIAVVELGSNTMRAGVHGDHVVQALKGADQGILYIPSGSLAAPNIKDIDFPIKIADDITLIVSQLTEMAKPGDHILIMSNKGFGGIHSQLLEQLTSRFANT